MLSGYCDIMNRDCVYSGQCIKAEDCYLYEVEKERIRDDNKHSFNHSGSSLHNSSNN